MSTGFDALCNDGVGTGLRGGDSILDRSDLIQDTASGSLCSRDHVGMHLPKEAERMDSLFDAKRGPIKSPGLSDRGEGKPLLTPVA